MKSCDVTRGLKEVGPLSDRCAMDGMNESSVNHLDVEWRSGAVDLVEFIMRKAREIFDHRDHCVVILRLTVSRMLMST